MSTLAFNALVFSEYISTPICHVLKFLSQLPVSENEYYGNSDLKGSSAAPETLLPHQEFRKSLKGQEASIPNLYSLLPEWSPRLHKEYERARDEVVDPWLQRWVDDPRTCVKLQKANFTVFAAIVCADASFDKLCTVAKSFAWYFIWDDQFDCGSLTYDTEGTIAYLKKCKEYFQYHLLEIGEHPDLSSFSKEQQKALLCWNEVGQHVRETCSKGMFSAFVVIVAYDTNEKTPSFMERKFLHWQNIGIAEILQQVFIHFIYDIEISKLHLKDPAFVALWRQTSYVVHITNDMLSMRKEARDNQIENLVPVLMMNYGIDCGAAMQTSFQMAKDEVKGILAVESCLRKSLGENDKSNIFLDSFIKGCKDVAMGLVHWSYSGERYFKRQDIGDDKTITFSV
ncbi:hypothetical protein MferCBS31731_001877 [Microsporum ferrugineum]